ncbi:MAG: bifunctional hydroxymethylpyrimidine kinase/phosphomethylpyrimidine kinase [Cyanobacteria bacterium J06621_8]
MTRIALTIAGSDSGGGAGIQADLKTFTSHRVHGTTALTCITAQNTLGVSQVEAVSVPLVKAQIDSVVKDLRPHGVKTGMLFNSQIIRQVAQSLGQHQLLPLVVDPVMVARTGDKLMDEEAIAALRSQLIPQATILTPNRYEAEILSGMTINNLDQLKQAAIAIHRSSGVKVVLAKGGSLGGSERGIDIWYDGQELKTLATESIATKNNNGTGCTLSAAICANLALGQGLWQSVVSAKNYVTSALNHALELGSGNGPLGHFLVEPN